MSKERCAEINRWAAGWTASDNSMIDELIREVQRCHSEIERLEKALDGSESLRHTIMTAALDAKRTFTKRISELEKINETIAAAYQQLQQNIANYHEHRKWEDWK